jgi:hypothetical protein
MGIVLLFTSVVLLCFVCCALAEKAANIKTAVDKKNLFISSSLQDDALCYSVFYQYGN